MTPFQLSIVVKILTLDREAKSMVLSDIVDDEMTRKVTPRNCQGHPNNIHHGKSYDVACGSSIVNNRSSFFLSHS